MLLDVNRDAIISATRPAPGTPNPKRTRRRNGLETVGMRMPTHEAEAKGDTELGQRLRQLRQQKSLTLDQVSKASGVSISTISKVEKGQVSPAYGTLRKIADGLAISWELLITGEQATAAGRW